MKRLLQSFWVLLLLGLLGVKDANAQLGRVSYRDTFQLFTTYCPGQKQYDGWGKWRAKLDTSLIKYDTLYVKGQYDLTGRYCFDKKAVQEIATALYKGVDFTTTCNGYTWEVGAAGACSAGGCVTSSDVVSFSGTAGFGTPYACWCMNPGYDFRPCIGNSNWGGVGVNSCGGSSQWMEATFIRKIYPSDMTTSTVNTPDLCAYTQDIKARFTNLSSTNIDSWNYYVRVNSTTYGPYKVKKTLRPEKDTLMNVMTSFSFTKNTNYNISVWTNRPNNVVDGNLKNDTFKILNFGFKGSPNAPVAYDTSVCGSQVVTLRSGTSAGDSIAWYLDKNATQLLGYGARLKTPYLSSGATYKFYAAAYNGIRRAGLTTTYAGGNNQSGNMFDIRSVAGPVNVDSIGINFNNVGVGNTGDVEVYIRQGSYLDPGANTTSTMWTLIYKGNVTSRGAGRPTPVPVKFTLAKNTQYALFVQSPTYYINYTNGNNTYNNGTIEIKAGYGIAAYWTGTFNPRTWNGTIYYAQPLCPSTTDSAEITVKPAPFGASNSASTPFETSPKNNGNGTQSRPDIVALGDTLTYALNPPTGYTSGGHNTTWKMNLVELKTTSGRIVNSTQYKFTDPSSSGDGTLWFTPDSTHVDSVIVAHYRFQDLGPHFCDTNIYTYMYVAPLPDPKYSFQTKVCDGDAVVFVNESKIKRGVMTYKWYFGDGDSSDVDEPVHVYTTYGTYYTKLVATAEEFGYKREYIDTIIVTQIPNVAFKVGNVCQGLQHTFTNQTTVSAGTLTYAWNFGDGLGTSTQKDPRYKYTQPGQYKVTLTATANGCTNSATRNAYLFPTPVANFSVPPTQFCSNNEVPFTNTSTILYGKAGQMWDFSDGDVATVKDPVHKFDGGGTYNVELISISEFGCADTVSKTVVIKSAPMVSFNNSQACDLTPAQFTSTSTIPGGTTPAYKWSFGDGATSTAQNPTHQYTVLGPKRAVLQVTLNNGCVDSFTRTINVGVQPTSDFEVANTCSDKAVQFVNKSTSQQGNLKYKWYFGNGDSSDVADPNYTYIVTGTTTYNVTLMTTVEGGCNNISTKQMTVYELPKCDFTITDDWWPTGDDHYRTVKVEALNKTYPFYRFKFSDGGSVNSASGLYQFGYEGEFTVTLYARNDVDCECQSTQTKAIRNSTNTQDLVGGTVKVYPNPSSGLVNVEAGNGLSILSVTVYNVVGAEVAAQAQVTGSNATVDLTAVSGGSYMVKIETDKGTVVRQISINR